MTDLDRWHAFETENPMAFVNMYQFWVQKTLAERLDARTESARQRAARASPTARPAKTDRRTSRNARKPQPIAASRTDSGMVASAPGGKNRSWR